MSEIQALVRNRILETREVRAEEVRLHPRNWRVHPEAQVKAVEGIVKQVGIIQPLIAYYSAREGGALTLIDGHLRRGLGHSWPVIITDLTDEEADLMLATLHPLGDMAEVDDKTLAHLLESIDLTPLEDEAFKPLMAHLLALAQAERPPEPLVDVEPQIDKAEELRAKWGVMPGDLWGLGEHKLICGDCTDSSVVARLMAGEMAQMLFTDPPYGVNYTGGHFHSGNVNIKREREKLANDGDGEIYGRFLPVILPFVDGPCYVWFADRGGKPVYDALALNGCEIHAMIIWHKVNATYAAMNAQYKQRHEPLLYFKPKGSTLRWIGPSDECTLWEMERDARNEYHPTQKPIALALRAIQNHDAMIVLDSFSGSGSTILACEQLGRQARAIEISPGYVAVTLQRYYDATGKLPELLERGESS